MASHEWVNITPEAVVLIRQDGKVLAGTVLSADLFANQATVKITVEINPSLGKSQLADAGQIGTFALGELYLLTPPQPRDRSRFWAD